VLFRLATARDELRRAGRRRAALAALVLLLAQAAPAGPEGESVAQGQVEFSRSGDTTTIRASHNSIINYRSFNIAANETVQFIQPSAASRVLNRITTPEPTVLNGTLLANGQVYIVNRAGVIFGKSCVVNAAGIVAAAANLSDRNFTAGIDRFTQADGAVANHGALRAERVCLLGRTVENSGSIVAPDGTITLAAGEEIYVGRLGEHVYVQLDTAGAAGPAAAADADKPVLGAGDVFSLAVRHTGTAEAGQIVVAAAPDGAVEVAGWLEAVDRESQRGGSIRVLGGRIAVTGGVLDASGPNAGGVVEIGTDSAGPSDAPAARQVVVAPEAALRANATARGDGGRVIVQARDAAGVYGELSARGGPGGGNGGFAETSGGWLDLGATPDLSAPQGRAGTWLIDPYDIEITDDAMPSATGKYEEYWTYVSSAAVTRISFATILGAFNKVDTVAVMTGEGGDGAGDITWNANQYIDLDYVGGSRRVLLAAHNGITINALPDAASDAGHVFQFVLFPNCDGSGGGEVHFGNAVPVPVPDPVHGAVDEWLVKPLPAGGGQSVMDIVVVRAVGAPAPGPASPLAGALADLATLSDEWLDEEKVERFFRRGDYERALRAAREEVRLARAHAKRSEATTQPVAKGPGTPKTAPPAGEERAERPGPTTRPVIAAAVGPRASDQPTLLAADWLALPLRFRSNEVRFWRLPRD